MYAVGGAPTKSVYLLILQPQPADVREFERVVRYDVEGVGGGVQRVKRRSQVLTGARQLYRFAPKRLPLWRQQFEKWSDYTNKHQLQSLPAIIGSAVHGSEGRHSFIGCRNTSSRRTLRDFKQLVARVGRQAVRTFCEKLLSCPAPPESFVPGRSGFVRPLFAQGIKQRRRLADILVLLRSACGRRRDTIEPRNCVNIAPRFASAA